MDHSTGSLRLDLEHTWRGSQPAQPLLPPADQMCNDQVCASSAASCLSLYGHLHGCRFKFLHCSFPSLLVRDLLLTDSTRVACLGYMDSMLDEPNQNCAVAG